MQRDLRYPCRILGFRLGLDHVIHAADIIWIVGGCVAPLLGDLGQYSASQPPQTGWLGLHMIERGRYDIRHSTASLSFPSQVGRLTSWVRHGIQVGVLFSHDEVIRAVSV